MATLHPTDSGKHRQDERYRNVIPDTRTDRLFVPESFDKAEFTVPSLPARTKGGDAELYSRPLRIRC